MKSSPCAAKLDPSSSEFANTRAKSLGPLRHDSSLPIAAERNRPPKSQSTDSKELLLDSCNLVAARMLYRLRQEAGLTQDEVAALSGESRRQVHRRETNKVFLGPLRALVVLERAVGAKESKK